MRLLIISILFLATPGLLLAEGEGDELDPFGPPAIPDKSDFVYDNSLNFRQAFARFGFPDHLEMIGDEKYLGGLVLIDAKPFGPIIGWHLIWRTDLVAIEMVTMDGRSSDAWGEVATRRRTVIRDPDEVAEWIPSILAKDSLWEPLNELEEATVGFMMDGTTWYIEARSQDEVKGIRLKDASGMEEVAPGKIRDYSEYTALFRKVAGLMLSPHLDSEGSGAETSK